VEIFRRLLTRLLSEPARESEVTRTKPRAWGPYDAGLLVDSPTERCGLVIKLKYEEAPLETDRYQFLEVRNISRTPEAHFEMDQEAMILIFNEHNVIGVWHSHPTGSPQPSQMDREWHPRQFDMYIIAGLRIHRYTPVGDRNFQQMIVPWKGGPAAGPDGRDY
jgi:proteasome lid subunit RPN8/RPN11